MLSWKLLLFYFGTSTLCALFAGTISGSKHDLSATNYYAPSTTANKEVCVFCHTPHGSTSQATPLWNRTITNLGAFQMYGETAPQGNYPNPSSLACLSCHDGVANEGDPSAGPSSNAHSLINPPTGDTGGPNCTACHFRNGNTYPARSWRIGPIMSDDHPVSISYSAAIAKSPTTFNAIPQGVKLFGANNNVECATCHDPHDPTNGNFLRINNAGSALCNSCHKR